MANQHRADTRLVTLWLDIDLVVKLKRLAKQRHTTMTAIITSLLVQETEHIELSAEDYKAITEEVARNEAKRK